MFILYIIVTFPPVDLFALVSKYSILVHRVSFFTCKTVCSFRQYIYSEHKRVSSHFYDVLSGLVITVDLDQHQKQCIEYAENQQKCCTELQKKP